MRIGLSRFNLGILMTALDGGEKERSVSEGQPCHGVSQPDIDEVLRTVTHMAERRTDADRVELVARLAATGQRLFSWDNPAPASPTARVFRLEPSGPAFDFWRGAEHLPFECAADGRGLLVAQNRGVTRCLDGEAPPPLVAGSEPIRLLIVSASPRGNVMRAAEPTARAVEQAAHSLPAIEVAHVSGPDTRRQIQTASSKSWHIVHVTAHGTRSGGGSVCLETPHGNPDHVPYASFAGELARELRGVRLVTLAVCDSSPLAIDLARELPGTCVVCFLTEVRQEILPGFFDRFYRSLLGPGPQREAQVEGAFVRTVAELYSRGEPEWCLPVLYAPRVPQAFLDLQLVEYQQHVLALARSGKLAEARREAQGLLAHRDAGLRTWAERMSAELSRLDAYEQNLEDLDDEILGEAAADRPDWRRLHGAWKDARLDVLPTAGVRARRSPGERVLDMQFLADVCQRYQDQATLALSALDDLQEGSTVRLVDGCGRLSAFLEARGRGTDEPVGRVLASGLLPLLKECEGNLGRDAPPELVVLALEKMAQVESATRRVRSELATFPVDAVEHRLRTLSDRARERLALQPRRPVPPRALLSSAPRLDLVLWALTSGRESASTEPMPTSSADLLELARARADHGSGLFTENGPGAGILTALANETAPIRLVARLARVEAGGTSPGGGGATDLRSEALHPFLVLHGYGAGADSSSDEWLRVQDRITGEPDGAPLKGLRTEHLATVTNDGQRLTYDALLLPVEDPSLVNERLSGIASAIRQGRGPGEEALAGARGLDRAGLLAAIGRTSEAADYAFALVSERGAARDQAQLERVRAAFLLCVHDGRIALTAAKADLSRHARRVREAIAMLGLLDTDPTLGVWVRMRYAVYGRVQPAQRDLTDRLREVRGELRRQVDIALEELEALRLPGATVRSLRNELESELRGAHALERLAPLGKGRPPIAGGFHAARLLGHAPEVAERLGLAYRSLSRLDHAEYVLYVTSDGVAVDGFHEAALSFCPLRSALVDSAEGRALRRLLPDPASMHEGRPADVGPLLDRKEEFLLYQGFPREEALRLLSAHVAVVVARASLSDIRSELSQEEWDQFGVKRALDWAVRMDGYLEALAYRLGGELVSSHSALVSALLTWCNGILERNGERVDGADSGADEAWRKKLEAACRLVDELQRWYPRLARPDYLRARSRLHLILGVFVANVFSDGAAALRHTRDAVRIDPDHGHAVLNYLIAATAESLRLAQTAAKAEGRVTVEEAKRLVGEYLEHHPNEGLGIRERLAETESAFDSVSAQQETLRRPVRPVRLLGGTE